MNKDNYALLIELIGKMNDDQLAEFMSAVKLHYLELMQEEK